MPALTPRSATSARKVYLKYSPPYHCEVGEGEEDAARADGELGPARDLHLTRANDGHRTTLCWQSLCGSRAAVRASTGVQGSGHVGLEAASGRLCRRSGRGGGSTCDVRCGSVAFPARVWRARCLRRSRIPRAPLGRWPTVAPGGGIERYAAL
eukprot:4727212-Prymnesium_polylepis.1